MKIFAMIILLSSLIGCASNNMTFGPQVSSNNPWHALAYVAVGVALTEKPSNECSAMRAERRHKCEQQVRSIKQHIAENKSN